MFTLAQAIAAIGDRKEFAVNRREYGTVIDYNVEYSTTFTGTTPAETEILLNLRGTIFDHSGKIIRLAYHKFKNVNQSPEYQESTVDLSQPHVVQEKLDGSMIAPFLNGSTWSFGTRAGVTDVAKLATAFYESMPAHIKTEYRRLIESALACDITPIFEFCSRANRIVVDYPTPKLVLTGMRSNRTGMYLPLRALDPLVEVVQSVSNTGNIKELAQRIALLQNEEGVVVKFDSGRMVKIKAELYCLRHRTTDTIRSEKDVLQLALAGQLDDVLALLDPASCAGVVRYSDQVLRNVAQHERDLRVLFREYRRISANRGDFAQLAKTHRLSSILFSWYSDRHATLSEYLLDYCRTQTRVDEMRELIGVNFNEV